LATESNLLTFNGAGSGMMNYNFYSRNGVMR